MDRDFVAEFSGRYAWIFFAAAMLLLLAAGLFGLFWMDGISPVLIPACLAVAVCMLPYSLEPCAKRERRLKSQTVC